MRRTHGLDDFNLEGAHDAFAGLGGCAARAVESVLLPIPDDAEAAIQDPTVGVEPHAYGEVELAVLSVAVEPVAVVDVTVAGGGVSDRLGRLVDRIVIESGEHQSLLLWMIGRARGRSSMQRLRLYPTL